MKSENTFWQTATVTRSNRERRQGHKGVIIWFTGLSGSGKSALAHAVEEQLYLTGCLTRVLDGDNLRHGLCADLGFSQADRTENIRRAGETANLFLDIGAIVLAAFISPLDHDRTRVRALVPPGDFLEIHCACPIAVCEARDTKGLYKRARAGEISEFTGISAPYEIPTAAELVIDTSYHTLTESVRQVMALLRARGVIAAGD